MVSEFDVSETEANDRNMEIGLEDFLHLKFSLNKKQYPPHYIILGYLTLL